MSITCKTDSSGYTRIEKKKEKVIENDKIEKRKRGSCEHTQESETVNASNRLIHWQLEQTQSLTTSYDGGT